MTSTIQHYAVAITIAVLSVAACLGLILLAVVAITRADTFPPRPWKTLVLILTRALSVALILSAVWFITLVIMDFPKR